MELNITIIYCLIGLATIIAYFWRKKLNYWKDRGIPFDEPHLIHGSMRGFRKNQVLQDIHMNIYNRFKGTGPFCGIFFFMRPAAFILDIALAKEILIKSFHNFPNRGLYFNERDDPLSAHLFGVDGIKWKQLRQKLTPTFTSGKIKFMFPTVVAVAEQFIQVFGDISSKGNIVEIKELCARFTNDVIGTCAFGIECNSLKDPNAEFLRMGHDALSKPRHNPTILGFMQSFRSLARKLHMRQNSDHVHNFFMRIVRETIEFREKNKIRRNDFMDLLVELKNTKAIKTEDGEVLTGLTVEEIAAQAFVFFLGGFETSSTTMGFALYELARHQDIQEKARREINEVLAKHDQKFTYECVKNLIYLNQVICETLRLYTVFPHIQREAVKDFVVPGNPKYRIEKGTLVIIPSSSFHRDPDIYPDPESFKPERFSQEEVLKRDPIDWLAFGDGPRNCIGKRFGNMQVAIGLAMLLKEFEFSVCDRTPIPIVYDPIIFTLAVKGGIELQVQKLT